MDYITTRTVSIRNKDNVTKTNDRKGKLRKDFIGREMNVIGT